MVSSEVKNQNRSHSSCDSSNGKSSPLLNPAARVFVPRNYYSEEQYSLRTTVPQQWAVHCAPCVTYGPAIPPPIPAPLPPPMQMPATIIVPFNVHFNYCPVVYPNRYGRPGTVYYMNFTQVPASAIPIAVRDGNGGYRTHFFNNVTDYC